MFNNRIWSQYRLLNISLYENLGIQYFFTFKFIHISHMINQAGFFSMYFNLSAMV